jgi:hypothetical protein
MRSGTLFEFGSPEELLRAIDALAARGYTGLDAFTPYMLPELDEKLGIRRTRIPWAVLVAGLVGCALAYWIIWFCNASDYPLIVGGRPFDSWPADVPIMFETAVLFASLCAFGAVLVRSGLPRLHHPVMETDGFESASIDGFWVGVPDAKPIDDETRADLVAIGARAVRRLGGAP